jgi:endonuclease/exonuclease/phosphatase family metal-dependent hydrolase
MLRRSWALRDFRSQKLSDVSTAMIGRHKESGIDHCAVDLGAFLATGVRICRDLVGPERDAEVAKYVLKNVASVILKKVRPQKSIAFFFDGSDPLWKLRRNRKVPHKSAAGRYTRSAGSPLAFVVEDKLRDQLTSGGYVPNEVIISGAATPGPAESKISAWALDLAQRSDVTEKDSICLIGSWDLAYSALAMTPFYNVSAVTLDRGDFKQVGMQEMVDWLTITDLYRGGDNAAIARVRTDIVLLNVVTDPPTATNLTSLPNLSFKEALDVYLEHFAAKAKYLTADCEVRPGDGGDDLVPFAPTIGVHAHNLADLLQHVTKKQAPRPKEDKGQCADYVEVMLQSLSMLVDGGIRDYRYHPTDPVEAKPQPMLMEKFIGHLRAMPPTTVLKPMHNEAFAVTAAEQVLLGALTTEMIDESLPAFANGHSLPPNVAESLLALDDVEEALSTAQKLLTPVKAKSEHRVFKHAPSHWWRRKPGEAGPPPGWEYASVDLGALSRQHNTRVIANARAKSGAIAAAKIKNALVKFDTASNTWVETDVKNTGDGVPKQLKIVTWNVQFDRFSGQTTPLGKPGIDWHTKTRYIALSKVLSTTDADIIALQETEPTWWEYLSRQPWVQQNYSFSCPMRGDPITPWGQVMLVHKRLPVTGMAAHNVPGYTGHTSVMPACSVQVTESGKNLSICGIHLLAPYTQSNINVRVTQIETLMKRLSPKNVGDDVVVMGDFNDYPSNFFVMPQAMGDFRDAWVEANGANDGDAGYSINGRTSKYTSLIIEPEFFGRADRVLVKSKHLKVTTASLIGTKSVREELGIASCPEYLFPSDHYGIMTTLAVTA